MENNQFKNILTKIGEVNPVNHLLIKQVYNNGELIQLAAVKQYAWAIEFIENPSERVQLAAVEKDPYSIQYIQNSTEKVKQLAKSKWSADDEAQDYYTFGKHKI